MKSRCDFVGRCLIPSFLAPRASPSRPGRPAGPAGRMVVVGIPKKEPKNVRLLVHLRPLTYAIMNYSSTVLIRSFFCSTIIHFHGLKRTTGSHTYPIGISEQTSTSGSKGIFFVAQKPTYCLQASYSSTYIMSQAK